ncbi:MAG TPA: ABC transporter ATP-binding protein [Acholeplasmataceae bacterium]|nr:ABC transporter ATP-binding protein [Acholeplasmataceae bacterium]
MYSVITNMKYVLNKSFEYDKKMKRYLIIHIICELLIPIITLLTTSGIVYMLSNNIDVIPYLGVVAGIVLFSFIIQILNSYSLNKYTWLSTFSRLNVFMIEASTHYISKDYELIEPKSGQQKVSQSLESLSSNWVGVEGMLKETPKIIINIIGFIVYTVVVAIYVPWVILIVLVMSLINIYLSHKANEYVKKIYPETSKLGRERYFLLQDLTDPRYGKDIRIFKMKNWFIKIFDTLTKKRVDFSSKTHLRYLLANASDSIFLFIRDAIAYALLIVMVIDGKIDVATFTFLIGLVFGFTAWVNGFTESFNNLRRMNIDVNYYREFVEMPNVFNHQKGLDISKLTHPIKITFKDVTFTYPDTDKVILENFNLEIKAGEKLAVVGPNGSGKTTLIKLLTGLYRPTSGQILINDIDILEFNINDYMELFSVVFQDSEPLAFTILENVTTKPQGKEDRNRFNDAIKKAGLKEKIDSLPNKELTYITQHFETSGISLSGGETQKLMLARALYKNAPILVLDEPTSALDPLNEERMYKAYDEFTKGNTSIFISHRLSSTRFCDRIIYLEFGKILEVGTHDELMALNGQYKYIFDVQSQYYKEEE